MLSLTFWNWIYSPSTNNWTPRLLSLHSVKLEKILLLHHNTQLQSTKKPNGICQSNPLITKEDQRRIILGSRSFVHCFWRSCSIHTTTLFCKDKDHFNQNNFVGHKFLRQFSTAATEEKVPVEVLKRNKMGAKIISGTEVSK